MVPIWPAQVGGSRDKAEEEDVVCSVKCCYCTVNVSQPMQCEAGAKASGDGREGSMRCLGAGLAQPRKMESTTAALSG